MTVAKLMQNGELRVKGIDTRLPLVTDGLVAHYPMDGTTHSTNTHFVAKAQNFPYETVDGIWDEYENTWLFNSGRSWHISVWDMYTNDWAVGINFQGATEITGPHARYDVYAVPTQITSFVNTINTLNSSNGRYMVAITGGHAAENNFKDSTVMKDAIKLCGGTTSKLSWTDRRTYICVGEVGCGEGNAQEEELGSTGDVTLRVPFFFYAKASTDTNTTITNDYVAIEEATTNLLSINDWNNSLSGWSGIFWTSGIRTYESTNLLYSGVNVLKFLISSTASGGPAFLDLSGISTTLGIKYTISVWFKSTSRICRTYGHDTANAGSVQGNNIIPNGEWQKSSYTFTTVSTTGKMRIHLLAESGNVNDVIYVTAPQVEQKAFATEYVNGSRSAFGKFTALNPVKTGEFTVSYDWKSNSPVGTSSSYQASFSMGTYYTNNSFTIMDTNSTSTGGTQRLIRKGNAGEWAWIDANLTETASFQDWTTITIVRNATYYRVYSNGIYKGQLAHSSATMQDYIHVGSRESWRTGENSSTRNLSIYNRALSDSEVTKLAKGTHSFNINGLITKSINSKPNIPSDAFYYPLDLNSKDEYNLYLPSEDIGNYADGLYVGSGNSVEYNFNSSLGLDWNGDWSICYFKKPIGTHLGETNLTGYNIESFGCNSNTVGGGYLWFGKLNSSNSIEGASNGAITPDSYFNNWQCITIIKSGTSVTISTWLTDKISRDRTIVLGTISSNRFVTQYGYDFKLSGWDNTNPCYSYFRDLIVVKRAITSDELTNYRNVKMKAIYDGLYIQNGINSTATL